MMKLYDVDGYDVPLRLDEAHAERIGASEHVASVEQPVRNANKAAWSDFAISQGGDPSLVENMTRTELIDQYGS